MRELIKLALTQRKLNGLIVFFSAFTIVLIGLFLINNIKLLNFLLSSLNIDYFVFKRSNIIFTGGIVIFILIFPTIILWSIRNKLWQGRRAFKRYFLILNLRRALLDAHYHDQRFIGSHIAKIPRMKIYFENRNMTSGKLLIRDSLEFHERLKSATFTPVLKGFKVESYYISDNGDWNTYEFFSASTQLKKEFTSLKNFINWSNNEVSVYQLRFDERLTVDLKHMILVGATRTGKTYAMIGLLLQMINKPIKYNLFFCDPKNDQIRKIGRWVNTDKTAVTTEEIIDLIDTVYQALIKREIEMELATVNRMTGDYRDVKLEPIILIFDEFSSFINILENKDKKEVLGKLIALVQRGAGAGMFIFLIMQKSDANSLPTAIRSNLLLKIVLGNAPSTTYTTAFESSRDIPDYNFTVGQGVFMDDTMSSPKLVTFPYLKFLDEYNEGLKNPSDLWNVKYNKD